MNMSSDKDRQDGKRHSKQDQWVRKDPARLERKKKKKEKKSHHQTVLTILTESGVSMGIASSKRESLILTVSAGALHVG